MGQNQNFQDIWDLDETCGAKSELSGHMGLIWDMWDQIRTFRIYGTEMGHVGPNHNFQGIWDLDGTRGATSELSGLRWDMWDKVSNLVTYGCYPGFRQIIYG